MDVEELHFINSHKHTYMDILVAESSLFPSTGVPGISLFPANFDLDFVDDEEEKHEITII